MTCNSCNLAPCACRYVEELLAGKFGPALPSIAQAQMKLPQPHRAACPCPACWSARLATFTIKEGEERGTAQALP